MFSTPRIRAVVFDLFNTLVPGGSRAERDAVSRQMAGVLHVDPAALATRIRDTFDARTRGQLGSLRETIEYLAADLGGTPPSEAVDAAVELRLAMTRSLHARSWAVPVLIELGRAGVRRGLVSDCSAETPAVWRTSPLAAHFDATSFSCESGHRKPEPEAYLIALRQLGVPPEESLFVGDGGSHELTGAAALGMSTVRIRAQGASLGESIDIDEDWSGPEIDGLARLLPLLGAPLHF